MMKFGFVLKLVGCMELALFMYFLSLWSIKRSVYHIIAITITIMPPFLGCMGAPVNYVMFNGFFCTEMLLKAGMEKMLLYMIIMSVLLAVFGMLSVSKIRIKRRCQRR